MSEQYDDLVQAIRKIARTDPEIQTALGPAKQKASIPAVRGIAYRNLDGGISSGQGELPDDANTDPDAEDEKNGKPTLKSDADNAPVINDDLQPGDQADKFKAYDCTTGDELALDLSPIPGQEYPAPDGWEDANEPPAGDFDDDGSWDDGHYYKLNNSQLNGYHGVSPTKSALCSTQGLGFNGTHCVAWNGFEYSIGKLECGAGANPDGAMCGLTPAPSEWPSNNKTELALINGQFTASQYDPDAAQTYKDNPPSQLEVCDGNGNRYQVSTAINNSTMLTKLNGDSSVPDDGESVLIDQSGTVTSRVANLFRNNYLP